ncbi:MAG: DNA polymerase III subunit delta [Planctomycetota bacterium]|nr:DNA polymerase III subunit delta [Planctomycetota bacterium]
MAASQKGQQSTKSATPSADHKIIVLHGKELFLRTEWTRRIVAALRERHGAIDEVRFAPTASIADVLDEVRSFGLICQHKVIIVDDADQFMQGEERRRSMERYAQAPVDSATLILRSDSWRPGNFDKFVSEIGLVFPCEITSTADATRWAIARTSKRHAAVLEADAAALLVDRVGPDLGRLDSELAKLGIAANTLAGTQEGGAITRSLVVQLIGLSREEQAWAIQEPVLAGQPAVAVRMVGELIQIARVPEVMVMWSMTELSRKLVEASALAGSGQSDREIASVLRLWGPSAPSFLRAARHLSQPRLRQSLRSCIRLDRDMKTGKAPDGQRALECIAEQLARTFA